MQRRALAKLPLLILLLSLNCFAQAADSESSPAADATATPVTSPTPAVASTPTPTPVPANEVRTDRLFPEGKVTDTPSFTQETHISYDKDGTKTWESFIKDATGDVVMSEIAIMKNDRVVTQKIEQRQLGKAFELNVEDGKGTFHTYEFADGKRGKEIDKKTVDAGERFMTGPMTDEAIQKNWNELMNGKTLRADFGVFEAMRTVEFKFSKNKDIDENVEILMKPASLVFRMFVPTIKLRFNKTTHKLVYFCGPTPVKVKGRIKMERLSSRDFLPVKGARQLSTVCKLSAPVPGRHFR